MMEWIKRAWKFLTFDMIWFSYFLITEPFRELAQHIKNVKTNVQNGARPKKLLEIMLVFFAAAIISKNTWLMIYALSAILLTFLWVEYHNKTWMERYRARLRKKVGVDYPVSGRKPE